MARKHQLEEVLHSLKRKSDCFIKDGIVQVLNGNDPKYPKSNDLGNGSWGKIDYLKNYHKYHVMYVDKFSK